MNKIIVQGKQEFLGKEVPIIKGGFGTNEKVILAQTVAQIHEVEVKYINELINNNRDEFEDNIDIIDLMDNDFKVVATDLGFIKSNRQKYCYMLSEQGYILLAGFMKTAKAKEIRKKFRRDYFSMKEQLEKIHKENKEIQIKQPIEILEKLDNKIVELDKYYSATHKRKLSINKMIKTCLGVNSSKENSNKVKEMLLFRLGYATYEAVPKDVLESKETANMIYEICKDVNNQFGKIQLDMFS